MNEQLRNNILQRDECECQFCGLTEEKHQQKHGQGLHIHHIVKRKDNGPNHGRNLITVCTHCHNVLEQTQANALSVLKDSITRQLETDDPVDNQPIIENSWYNHAQYGPVVVKDVYAELTGYSNSGRIETVKVEFSPGSETMRYSDEYAMFKTAVDEGPFDRRSELREELEGRMA